MNGRYHILANSFPFKHAWDSLALAKMATTPSPYQGVTLGLAERAALFRFYFNANGIRRIYAASPRSGHLWSDLGMALAIDLANGNDGEYSYEDGLFFPRDGLHYRRLDWRVPTGAVNKMYHRQNGPTLDKVLFYHTRNPYFRLRAATLKKSKIVVLVRNIIDGMESGFIKSHRRTEKGVGQTDDFDWVHALERFIEFYNSWGAVKDWHPSLLSVRYEDLKADEVGGHREILKFWGFDVPEDCIREGFRRASKKEMLSRVPDTDRYTTPLAVNRTATERGSLPEDKKTFIIDRIKCDLIYDFNYAYSHDMSYGQKFD